jgi:hypothetical protein
MMTGTLGGVKRLKRTVEVVRQTSHSALRQWRPGLFPRAVERCLTSQVLEVRHRCPATRGCVAMVPASSQIEAKRQPSVSEDGDAINRSGRNECATCAVG